MRGVSVGDEKGGQRRLNNRYREQEIDPVFGLARRYNAYLVAEAAVVGVFHDGHELNRIVAVVGNARDDVVRKVAVPVFGWVGVYARVCA